MNMEGKRSWWGGWASNPVGGAMRCRVGSTPAPLRHDIESSCCATPCWPCDARRTKVRLCVSDQPEAARNGIFNIVWARGTLRCSGWVIADGSIFNTVFPRALL